MLGERMHERLQRLIGRASSPSGVPGLWAGIDVDPALGDGPGRSARCSPARGVLAKDTHGCHVRLAPPLVIAEDDLAFALDQLEGALADLAG